MNCIYNMNLDAEVSANVELEEIQCFVSNIPFDLCEARRKFILKGPLKRLTQRNRIVSYYVYLFSDIILFTRKGKDREGEVHLYVTHKQLRYCTVTDFQDSVGERDSKTNSIDISSVSKRPSLMSLRKKSFSFKNAFELQDEDKHNFTLIPASADTKRVWKSSIDKQIHEANGKEYFGYSRTNSSPDLSSMLSSSPITRLSAALASDIDVESSTSSDSSSPRDSSPLAPTVLSSRASMSIPPLFLQSAVGMCRSIDSGPSTLSTERSRSSSMSLSPSYLVLQQQSADSSVCSSISMDSEPDDDHDVVHEVFEDDIPHSSVFENGSLTAAPARIVVWMLIYSDQTTVVACMHAIIHSFTEYSSPAEFFDILLEIYRHDTPPKEINVTFPSVEIRKRIASLFQMWIENYFDRDFNNPEFFQKLLTFISTTMKAGHQQKESYLLKLAIIKMRKNTICKPKVRLLQNPTITMFRKSPTTLKASLSGLIYASTVTTLPPPKAAQVFLDLNPSIIAEQLTVKEHKAFKKVQMREFQKAAWQNTEKSAAPYLIATIDILNQVGGWVCTEILIGDYSIAQRTAVIEKFILIAQRLLELRNFSGLFAILGGLNRAGVQRLKRAWKSVNSSCQNLYTNLFAVTNSERNFQAYKDEIQKSNLPCIPYLGVTTSNAYKIEDANPDTIDGMVNVTKIHMFAKIYKELMYYQRGKYQIVEEETMQIYLDNLPACPSEDLLYKHSLFIEPRKRASLMLD